MDILPTVTFFGAILVGLITLAAILFAFLRGEGPNESLFLYEMLQRQGDGAARLAIASGGSGFAVAVRRCLYCRSTARCREWLDAGNREGFDQFCGNAGYVSRMSSLAATERASRWT